MSCVEILNMFTSRDSVLTDTNFGSELLFKIGLIQTDWNDGIYTKLNRGDLNFTLQR